MKTISVFNNKGGVGKTTLSFHLAHALAKLGHRTLIIDLDPQCNLTIFGMNSDALHKIWSEEDDFIADFKLAREVRSKEQFEKLISKTRSIHFLLKPVEDGVAELDQLPPPLKLADKLDLIPGRLTMHLFENAIARRWSDVYQGDPLAVRTVIKPRDLAEAYAREYDYDFVIMDTSPSLGTLNKVIISTTDGFLIPCMPDMFSLYGIRNIGQALTYWKREFETIDRLLSIEKRKQFPKHFVRLLGFTIYNAKRYENDNNPWNLATAHYQHAKQIPDAINKYIDSNIRDHIKPDVMSRPIGDTAVMHTHNTMPAQAQKYHTPIWLVPSKELDPDDSGTIRGNKAVYEATEDKYAVFAKDLLQRIRSLDE